MASPFEKWFYGLLNSCVVGGSTAVVSALGLATAHGLGVQDIPQVNWHTIEVVFASGAASKFFIYMAQGLPQLQPTISGQSDVGNPSPNKPPTNTNP